MTAKQQRIGIIGGSGLDCLEGLQIVDSPEINTPWGKPSDNPKIGQFADVEVVFLPRHGQQHQLPPHSINYRANIAALHQLGVTTIIACNAVGGINTAMATGALVLPDQIIDYTWGRVQSFCDGRQTEALQHIDFTQPFSEQPREGLLKAAQSLGLNIHSTATFGVTQGPRLETAAEINRMTQDGCDIVGMTSMPEAALAREKAMQYAAIALVVNPAAGLSDQPITEAGMRHVMTSGMASIRALLSAYLHQLPG